MKTKTRIKPATSGIRSGEHFLRTCDTIAEIDVKLRAAEAARDADLQRVRDTHEPAIVALRDRRDAQLTLAEAYAFGHADELFGKTRSSESSLARYGIRVGQPSLKLINRKWTWAKVLETLEERLPQFVRTKAEPNKEALKAHLGQDAAALADIGLKIEQAESFWLEAKDTGEEAAQ